ncbi:nuclease-related domain-containing protein [Geodermatophilus sp. SYSU D00700]
MGKRGRHRTGTHIRDKAASSDPRSYLVHPPMDGLGLQAMRGRSALEFLNDVDVDGYARETEASVAQAQQQLPRLVDELDTVLARGDCVDLYRKISAMDRWRRVTLPSGLYYGSDASLEYLAARIVARPAEDTLSRFGQLVTYRDVMLADQLLREIANARHLVLFADEAAPGSPGTPESLTRLLLRSEFVSDRMGGYRQHLRAAYRAILEPLQRDTIKTFGFDPLLVFDVVDAYQRVVNERERIAFDRVLAPRARRGRLTRDRLATFEHLLPQFIEEMSPAVEDISAIVSTRLPVDHADIAAVVATLTTPLGTRGSSDEASTDSVLWRPIIGLDDGRQVWSRPDDFLDATLSWYDAALGSDASFRARFDRSRQSRTEMLTADALAAVLPASRVHLNSTFEDDATGGEVDVLVTLPGAVILVEAKGVRLTGPARAGRPDRVRRKIEELVVKPLGQLDRAALAIASHPGRWRSQRKRKPIPITGTEQVIKLLVSLDRVDPFSSSLAGLAHGASSTHHPGATVADPASGTTGAADRRVPADAWAVPLLDLMAVTELLASPAEFLAYASARQRTTAAGRPIVFMETDALAAWLSDRAGAHPEPTPDLVLESDSEAINWYFNAAGLGIDAHRPASQLPPLIADSLVHLLQRSDPQWAEAALELLAIHPRAWQPVLRALDEATHDVVQPRPAHSRRARRLAHGWRIDTTFVQVMRASGQPTTPWTPLEGEGSPPRVVIHLDIDHSIAEAAWVSGRRPGMHPVSGS